MGAIESFLDSVNSSLLQPLQDVQAKLGLQKDIRENKRFAETEGKLAEFYQHYRAIKGDLMQSDKVVTAIRNIHATRMTQFLEKGREMSLEESEALKAVLEPYLSLLNFVDGIRRNHVAMAGQGKLKKLPLPYPEINASLDKVKEAVEKLPKSFMDSVSRLSEELKIA